MYVCIFVSSCLHVCMHTCIHVFCIISHLDVCKLMFRPRTPWSMLLGTQLPTMSVHVTGSSSAMGDSGCSARYRFDDALLSLATIFGCLHVHVQTFDTFAPIGPAIVTTDDLSDPHNVCPPPHCLNPFTMLRSTAMHVHMFAWLFLMYHAGIAWNPLPSQR